MLLENSLKQSFSLPLMVEMQDSDTLRIVARIIKQANYLVALTGAGISKESNVPTFRGEDGLWKKHDAMQLATPEAFRKDPQLVWEWYSWRQSLIAGCSPNPAHEALATWEQKGVLKSLITQNVDGLHARAGSTIIYEVHGNLWSLKCTSCEYTGQLVEPAEEVPICPSCGSHLRPDVVWFGESLDQQTMLAVYRELESADVCLVIGTSALVQPAASFPLIVKERGGSIIEVNTEETPLSPIATVHLHGKAAEILPRLDSLIHLT
jgi:NAD-dependent deacetylase